MCASHTYTSCQNQRVHISNKRNSFYDKRYENANNELASPCIVLLSIPFDVSTKVQESHLFWSFEMLIKLIPNKQKQIQFHRFDSKRRKLKWIIQHACSLSNWKLFQWQAISSSHFILHTYIFEFCEKGGLKIIKWYVMWSRFLPLVSVAIVNCNYEMCKIPKHQHLNANAWKYCKSIPQIEKYFEA